MFGRSKRKQVDEATPAAAPPRRRWRKTKIALLSLVALLCIGRLMMARAVVWYVNRVINQSPAFHGKIGDVSIHLWRGAYSIEQIRLIKITGNVPVPLFAAQRLDLTMQWNALLHGRLVGQIVMVQPELNFVDAPEPADAQTGGGGPWLAVLRDLFPFEINSAVIQEGSVHFLAYQTKPPFDIYLSHMQASIENLSNIRNATSPLQSTVVAHALAMDHAPVDLSMKLDPTSYKPHFQLSAKLTDLDVTRTNNLSRAYGQFDFEQGWFDLVVELNARGGGLDGYIKPLFRNLQIIGKQDLKEDNILGVFWEALVGATTKVLSNPPKDQFGTVIPLSGDLDKPQADLLTTVGNILRNAFVRAYLPQYQGTAPDTDGLLFGTGTDQEPNLSVVR